MDKNHLDKTFQTKDPLIKPRAKTPHEQLRVFCTRPNKDTGGSEMCDVLLGFPGCVAKSDRGGGVKIGQK